MAKDDNKRFYWLKLDKGFFKKAEIKVIENMPNGKDYILFYLKLLCESTSHEGNLRLNEMIPYSEEMLATITDTNIDVVRSAIKIFTQLKMMDILDDGTIYLLEVKKMIGCETGAAIRKREERAKKNLLEIDSGDNGGQCPPYIEIEKDKEKDKEIDIELDNKETTNNKESIGIEGGDFGDIDIEKLPF